MGTTTSRSASCSRRIASSSPGSQLRYAKWLRWFGRTFASRAARQRGTLGPFHRDGSQAIRYLAEHYAEERDS